MFSSNNHNVLNKIRRKNLLRLKKIAFSHAILLIFRDTEWFQQCFNITNIEAEKERDIVRKCVCFALKTNTAYKMEYE